MRFPSLRLTLRVTAVLSWLVAIGWFIYEPGPEALIAFLTGTSTFLLSFKAPDSPFTSVLSERQKETLQTRNREKMLQKVKAYWVEGVLENSLHGVALLELGMEYKPEAVDYPWEIVLHRTGHSKHALRPGTSIIEVFEEVNEELLILGEPGSGKTTMMLVLTRELIARAEQENDQPMPVVFNLSSWADERKPLADWLVDELSKKYLVPRIVAEEWVRGEQVLPLLDGLDEVKQEHREKCLEIINQFRQQEHGLGDIVICSRTVEYEALNTQLKLEGAIVLQPLTPKQVNDYLAGASTDFETVRAMLKHDTKLQELLQSPLMLSIMVLAYRGMSVEKLQRLDTFEDSHRLVFAAYVQQMFERRSDNQRYSTEKVLRWMKWLAQKMSQHSQTLFLIENMQPSWLEKGRQRLCYRLLVGLCAGLLVWLWVGLFGQPFWQSAVSGGMTFVGLVWGLIAGLFLGLLVGLLAGRFWGLLVWLLAGLLGWLWVGLFGHFFWLFYARDFTAPGGMAFVGLFWGLIAGLFLGLIVGLLAGLFGTKNIKPMEVLTWSWRGATRACLVRPLVGLLAGLFFGLINGLVMYHHVPLINRLGLGLVWGLILGLVGVLLGGLLAGLRGRELSERTNPNQGIRQSAKNAVIVGLLGGLLAGLLVGLLVGLLFWAGLGLTVWLFVWLFWGLFGGLFSGGLSVIQHLILRLLLWRRGHTPLAYAQFLDYATERIFP